MLNGKWVTFIASKKCVYAYRCVLLTVFKYLIPSFDSKSFCYLKKEKNPSLQLFQSQEQKLNAPTQYSLTLTFVNPEKISFFTAGHSLSNKTRPPLCSALWLTVTAHENEHWLLLCTLLMNMLSPLSLLYLSSVCILIYNVSDGVSEDATVNG